MQFVNGNRIPEADEYIKDNLIYCKKCGTARQCIIQGHLLNCICKCQEDKNEEERQQELVREREYKIKNIRYNAMPVKYFNYTLEADDKKTPEFTEVVKKYINNFAEMQRQGNGLMLCGDVGTGKTFFAVCIANALIDKGYKVKCTSLAEIISTAQDFNKADDFFNDLMNCKLIVVDDLGTERTTSFGYEKMFDFIDGAIKNNICLIITTNLTPAVIKKNIQASGDINLKRIYDRVFERCYPVLVNSFKRRENLAKENNKYMKQVLGI